MLLFHTAGKRYTAADANTTERKRKLKRQKEQRSKLHRKQKKLATRKTAEVSYTDEGRGSAPAESADDNSDNGTN